MRAELAAPSVSLEGLLQGRFRDVARIIGDRRSGSHERLQTIQRRS